MERITFNGTAENSKAGAIVITKDNKVYFIEGLTSWDTEFYQKQIEVEGNLQIQYGEEETLRNDNGEYKQGLSGEMLKILKPKYKLYNWVEEKDSVITKLKESLPENWELKIENKKLQITCSQQVYMFYENKINAPLNSETQLQKEERFKKNGKLINPKFVFDLGGKLSNQEIERIKTDNNDVKTKISKLHKTLKNIPVSVKDGKYLPRNKEEEKRVFDYEKEKNNLENKLIRLPDYQSEKYALYFESEDGIETEYISVYPEKSAEDMYKIKHDIFKTIMYQVN